MKVRLGLMAGENLSGNRAYVSMHGPNEFVATGNLRDWDRIDRLNEIQVPVLITVGEFDEITPTCAKTMRDRIEGAELVEFKGCAHLPHLEDTDRFVRTVSEFLMRND